MYLSQLCEQGATERRIRYAVRTILRDRLSNEGAFNICFEMEDGEDVIAAILKRGIANRRLRMALERSHLINLPIWLCSRPNIAEIYYRLHSAEDQECVATAAN